MTNKHFRSCFSPCSHVSELLSKSFSENLKSRTRNSRKKFLDVQHLRYPAYFGQYRGTALMARSQYECPNVVDEEGSSSQESHRTQPRGYKPILRVIKTGWSATRSDACVVLPAIRDWNRDVCVLLVLKTAERGVRIEVGLSDMFEAPELERLRFFGWKFLLHPLKLSEMQTLSPQSLLQT